MRLLSKPFSRIDVEFVVTESLHLRDGVPSVLCPVSRTFVFSKVVQGL